MKRLGAIVTLLSAFSLFGCEPAPKPAPPKQPAAPAETKPAETKPEAKPAETKPEEKPAADAPKKEESK